MDQRDAEEYTSKFMIAFAHFDHMEGPLQGGRPLDGHSEATIEEVVALEMAESLTVEEATRLVDLGCALDLKNLRHVSIDVAKALGRSPFDLRLPSITGLEIDTAFWLSRGRFLYLTGLRELPVRVARRLHYVSMWLDLGGVENLSVAAAYELARTEAWLSLRGVKELSPSLARALARHKGMGLSLGGLRTLTEECAWMLTDHQGGWLRLAGLSEPSPAVRAILRHHVGEVKYH